MSRRAAAAILLAGLGWASLQGQVGLLRELLVAASGSELALLLGLAAWMTGTAAGALLARAGAGAAGWRGARLGLQGFGLLLPAAAVLLRLLRVLAREPPGALLPLGALGLGALPALALPGVLSGWLFVRAAGPAAEAGIPLGAAYGLESLGGLAGGLSATLLPAAGLGTLAVVLSAGGLAALAAAAPDLRPAWWPVPLLLLGALPASSRLDPDLSRVAQPFLAAACDTPYGRVSVTRRLGQSAVYLDGALAFDSQGTAAEETAHTAALLVDRPGRILLLGGAAEGLLPPLLQHRPERVDCVELDLRGLGLALSAAPPGTREALADPAVRLLREDPRRHLARSRERYDLILSALPAPQSGASARMWTREAFGAMRARLRPGGAAVLRLRAPEALWTALDLQRGASLAGALRAAFPCVRLLPGPDTLLVASDAPLPRDPAPLLARWRARGLDTRVFSEAALAWRLRDPRGPALETALAAPGVPPSTDARPICHTLTLALWLSRFAPGLAARPLRPPPGPAGAALALAAAGAVGLLGATSAPRGRALLLAALAGGSGMVLQAALLMAFQARHGVLYQDLGLLTTLFMGGMAAGAGLLRVPPRGPLAALALAACATGLAAAFPARLTWAATSLLLPMAGAASGALFGAAGRLHPAGAGPLYAADLAGGCLGALAAALALPLMGLAAGPVLVAVLALGAWPAGAAR